MSHPSWVRGLKQNKRYNIYKDMASHPSWVRGLKLYLIYIYVSLHQSHPSWVRGLKLLNSHRSRYAPRRTPRGCVD